MEADTEESYDSSSDSGSMIFSDHDRFEGFLKSFPFELPEYLSLIREKALKDNIPIIRDDTQRFIVFLMKSFVPKRILEIGTAVGFSALLMAHFDSSLTELVTIEDYEPRKTSVIQMHRSLFLQVMLRRSLRDLTENTILFLLMLQRVSILNT